MSRFDVRNEIEHQIAMAKDHKAKAERGLDQAQAQVVGAQMSIAVAEEAILHWQYLLETFDARQSSGEEDQ